MFISLEFKLESLILKDLARNIGEAIQNGEQDETTKTAIDLVMSQAETRNLSSEDEATEIPRVFMARNAVHS